LHFTAVSALSVRNLPTKLAKLARGHYFPLTLMRQAHLAINLASGRSFPQLNGPRKPVKRQTLTSIAKLTLAPRAEPCVDADGLSADTVYFTPASTMASAANLASSIEPAGMEALLAQMHDVEFFANAQVIATNLPVA
jgi:hypothetical protein